MKKVGKQAVVRRLSSLLSAKQTAESRKREVFGNIVVLGDETVLQRTFVRNAANAIRDLDDLSSVGRGCLTEEPRQEQDPTKHYPKETICFSLNDMKSSSQKTTPLSFRSNMSNADAIVFFVGSKTSCDDVGYLGKLNQVIDLRKTTDVPVIIATDDQALPKILSTVTNIHFTVFRSIEDTSFNVIQYSVDKLTSKLIETLSKSLEKKRQLDIEDIFFDFF